MRSDYGSILTLAIHVRGMVKRAARGITRKLLTALAKAKRIAKI